MIRNRQERIQGDGKKDEKEDYGRNLMSDNSFINRMLGEEGRERYPEFFTKRGADVGSGRRKYGADRGIGRRKYGEDRG